MATTDRTKGVVKIDKANPKDVFGEAKVPLGLLPAAGKIHGALSMQSGSKKYGPYNWRESNVRMSIYLDAIERHLLALRDGEDLAPDSGVTHLGHIIASASIILDAEGTKTLIDDRPPKGPCAEILKEFTKDRV